MDFFVIINLLFSYITKGTASFDGIFSGIFSFIDISSKSFSLSLGLFIVPGNFLFSSKFISDDKLESEDICSRILS